MLTNRAGKLNITRAAISLTIFFCMILFMISSWPGIAFADDTEPTILASGTCGAEIDNAQWTLYSDGTLRISGTGNVAGSPWTDYRSRVKKIIVDDGITFLSYRSFYGCTNLKEVELPESLRAMDHCTFENCTSLEQIYLPDGLTSVGSIFCGCTALKSVRLPSTLTVLGDDMFFECTSLESIVIPSCVKEIGTRTFQYCSNLKNITFSEGLTKIGPQAFYECSALKNIDFPESLQIIDDRSFCGSGLESLEVPSATWRIGESAFERCNNLKEVTLPDGLVEIGDHAFASCPSLIWLELPDGVEVIGDDILLANYDIYNTEISLPESAAFDGQVFTPAPTVTYQGHKLVEGTDYLLSYAISADKSLVFATITGIGRFYNITEVSFTNPNYTSGSGNDPDPGNDPSPGDDPDPTDDPDPIIVPPAPATPKSISSAKVSGLNDLKYTGYYLKPVPVVTYGGKKLTKGTDYKLSYLNNKKVGTATVVITGINKYTGSVRAHFAIKQASNEIRLKKSSLSVSFGDTVDLSKYASSTARLHYRSGNKAVAAVTRDGTVRFKHPGTVKIRLSSGGINYEKSVRTITISSTLDAPRLKVKLSKGKAKLTWSRIYEKAEYQLYVRFPGKSTYVKALTKPSNVKSVTHRGLTRGKTYRYKVRAAVKIDGKWYYSRYSGVKKIKAI